MRASKLALGELFTFKRRDPFKPQLDGVVCRNIGMGLFQTVLPLFGDGWTTYSFHHKDRVKSADRRH